MARNGSINTKQWFRYISVLWSVANGRGNFYSRNRLQEAFSLARTSAFGEVGKQGTPFCDLYLVLAYLCSPMALHKLLPSQTWIPQRLPFAKKRDTVSSGFMLCTFFWIHLSTRLELRTARFSENRTLLCWLEPWIKSAAAGVHRVLPSLCNGRWGTDSTKDLPATGTTVV
jgi:hypothetical protein